jgi:hypothetical protein
MNYTGFGTDPNLIYSFRGGMATGPAMGSGQYTDRFSGLRNSPAYKQADARGRQRMEQAVEMGLPAQTDISRARRTGIVTMDRRPEYVATRPQPWGTHGSVGMNEEPPAELRETMLGPTRQPLAFTGFGQTARNQKADQYQTPIGRGLAASGMQVPSTRFGDVSLRFPFAGAESALERATRTATTFGGTPMFPSSRFGGPQPAERLGPVDAQPRRSWMY